MTLFGSSHCVPGKLHTESLKLMLQVMKHVIQRVHVWKELTHTHTHTKFEVNVRQKQEPNFWGELTLGIPLY